MQFRLSSAWFNEVYLPYIDDLTPEQDFFGGAGSGKSKFLAQRAIRDVMTQDRNYLCTRKQSNTLVTSQWNELYKVVNEWGLKEHFHCITSPPTITCKLNEHQILFGGLDDVEKLKSITPIKGVITDIWSEEATENKHGDIQQLRLRLRGGYVAGRVEVPKRMIMSYNPTDRRHWINQTRHKGFVADGAKVARTDDMLIVRTTYRDNRFLSPSDVRRYESEKNENVRRIYLDGLWGSPNLEGKVFAGWSEKNIVEEIEPKQYRYIFGGYDRGFSHRAGFAVIGVSADLKSVDVLESFGFAGLPLVDVSGGDSRLECVKKLQNKWNVEYWFCSHEAAEDIDCFRKNNIRADSWMAKFGAFVTINIKNTEKTKTGQRIGFVDTLIRFGILKVPQSQVDLITEINELEYKRLPDGTYNRDEIRKEDDDIIFAASFAISGYGRLRAEIIDSLKNA